AGKGHEHNAEPHGSRFENRPERRAVTRGRIVSAERYRSRTHLIGNHQIPDHHQREQQAKDDEQHDARAQDRAEHAAKTKGAEPQSVGPNAGEDRTENQQRSQSHQRGDKHTASSIGAASLWTLAPASEKVAHGAPACNGAVGRLPTDPSLPVSLAVLTRVPAPSPALPITASPGRRVRAPHYAPPRPDRRPPQYARHGVRGVRQRIGRAHRNRRAVATRLPAGT